MNTRLSFTECCFLMITLAMFQACSPKHNPKEKSVTESVELSSRLHDLFSKTKLVCFGRYSLLVPEEAQLIWGGASFPSKIETVYGGIDASKLRIESDIAKIRAENKTANITYNQKGPIENSWQFRYYPSRNAKLEGLFFFNTYVSKGDLTFILRGAIEDGETEESASARETVRIKNLRPRSDGEVPRDPGFCIEHGFIHSKQYNEQEIVDVGIYFPTLPDVSLSISSNKNAYSDYSPDEFEQTRHELSLLARIQQAKDDQGDRYPKRTVFREGKRDVQSWRGEESLIRRADGAHDFEWALVGKPKDVANPPEFNVQMYSKVEHNTVGAAKVASLTDQEAIALWDQLLSGLKFRVKVPGAPEGTYYFPEANQKDEVQK